MEKMKLKGKLVLFIGRSGSGKTYLANKIVDYVRGDEEFSMFSERADRYSTASSIKGLFYRIYQHDFNSAKEDFPNTPITKDGLKPRQALHKLSDMVQEIFENSLLVERSTGISRDTLEKGITFSEFDCYCDIINSEVFRNENFVLVVDDVRSEAFLNTVLNNIESKNIYIVHVVTANTSEPDSKWEELAHNNSLFFNENIVNVCYRFNDFTESVFEHLKKFLDL